MTVLFRDPPTRGPVMDFCESEARGGEKKKKNLGHSLLSLSASRVSCSGASRRGLLCADRIMKCSTSRPPARPIGGERSLKRALGMERPSTNQRSVLALVYTQRHMASLRCPCESGWGR